MKYNFRFNAVRFLAGVVFLNGALALAAYSTGRPELTALTGHAMMSSPAAIAIFCTGIALWMLVGQKEKK